jgi:hypothetical protein
MDAPSKLNWIKVEDQLPKNKQPIIFKANYPLFCAGFMEKTESGYQFYHQSSDQTTIYPMHGITHWMSLYTYIENPE